MQTMTNGRERLKFVISEYILPGILMAFLIGAVVLTFAGALDKEAAAAASSPSFFSVDNPVNSPFLPVSKSLDIDQCSTRQASTRRPDTRPPSCVDKH